MSACVVSRANILTSAICAAGVVTPCGDHKHQRERMGVYRGLYQLCLAYMGIAQTVELRTHAIYLEQFEDTFVTLTCNFVTNMMQKHIVRDSVEYKANVHHYSNDFVELFERLCVIV